MDANAQGQQRLERLRSILPRHAPQRTWSLEDHREAAASAASARELPEGSTIRPAVDAPGPGEWVVPANAPEAPGARVALYLHGGGFVMGGGTSSRPFAANLAHALGCPVFVADYRLAPETPFPGAVDDAYESFAWLARTQAGADRVIVCGDSAGASLALTTALRARRELGNPPAALIGISGWYDLSAARQPGTAAGDPLVADWFLARMRDWYLQGGDPRDPLASPLLGDLAGLPPTLIQVGGEELLLEDSLRLASKAEESGVEVSLERWEGLMHVWHDFAPVLPQANEAFSRIGEWTRRLLPD